MREKNALWDDIIDAVFRPVIAFFSGMFLGYVAQLAEVSNWVVAGAFMLIMILFGSFLTIMDDLFYRWTDSLFDKIGWGSGIKPVRDPVKRRKHWFVRFGWLPFIALGVAAVYVLPEEVLAWL